MGEERQLTCIGCPRGCSLKVYLEGTTVKNVTGNACNRGYVYGEKQCTNPTRIVTSCVKVKDGVENVVSVKTEQDIPKGKIFQCLEALKDVVVEAPVAINDIIIRDVADTGINIIATKNVDAK